MDIDTGDEVVHRRRGKPTRESVFSIICKLNIPRLMSDDRFTGVITTDGSNVRLHRKVRAGQEGEARGAPIRGVNDDLHQDPHPEGDHFIDSGDAC